MQKMSVLMVAVMASFWGSFASAGAQCEGPIEEGNTWNLTCAADGSGDSEYQCSYFLSLTNAQGLRETIEASGSVGQGQSGVIIWSGIQSEGADIVSANAVSGSCSL
jgi:invasion protein IalB